MTTSKRFAASEPRILNPREVEITRDYYADPANWFKTDEHPKFANIPNLLATIDALAGLLSSSDYNAWEES